MYGFLLALLVVDAIFLGIVVLLQAGKGGGLASMGGPASGTEMFFGGGRQATTVLTRASWASGGLLMVLALVLSIMSSRAQQPESILQDVFREQPTAEPLPLLPGVEQPGGGEGAGPGAPAPQGGTPSQTPATTPAAPRNP